MYKYAIASGKGPRSAEAALGPFSDDGRQDLERHVAAQQHRVVEALEVKAVAEAGARLLAQPDELVMADLVAAGLARPDDVAVDLALRGARVEPDGVDEIADRLVAAPAFGVHAGVHHHPGGAVEEALQHADPALGEILILADLAG